MVNQSPESSYVRIRRGKCDSLDIYEVTEWELEILKRWSTNWLFLNLCIAFISIAVSIGTTLLTVDFTSSDKKFYIFVIVLVWTSLAWVILGVIWYKWSDDFKDTLEKIEKRIQDVSEEYAYDSEDESIEPLKS
jgi:hypothetical protein